MASGGGGESVVAFFRRLGVPNAEALKPDDLDWMLENVTNVNSDGTSGSCRFDILTEVNVQNPLMLRSKFGVYFQCCPVLSKTYLGVKRDFEIRMGI